MSQVGGEAEAAGGGVEAEAGGAFVVVGEGGGVDGAAGRDLEGGVVEGTMFRVCKASATLPMPISLPPSPIAMVWHWLRFMKLSKQAVCSLMFSPRIL